MSFKNSGKRKKRFVKEESPTETIAAEAEKGSPEAISPGSREDLEAAKRWDDIGEEEEMHLASTREELYELIMNRKTFECKVKEKSSEEVFELMKTLLDYSRENVVELRLLQAEEVEVDPNERSRVGRCTWLAFFQQRRIGWMSREIRRRFLKEQEDKEMMLNSLLEENGKLRKSLEVVVRERGELLEKRDSRRVEYRDASVATEAEVPEIEMEADLSAPRRVSTPPREISRGFRGTLEAIIEEKVMEILSRVGPPIEGRITGVESSNSGAGHPPRDVNSWSEVVKGRRRKGPTVVAGPTPSQKVAQVRSVALHPDKGTVESGVPTKSRRVRLKKKERKWPTPPSTAAVVLTAPAGRESACSELLSRAKMEISLEEIGVPSLVPRRARTGGLILGVPGQQAQRGADRLAARLSCLAAEFGVKVSRPVKKAEIRVTGLDESTTVEEVTAALSKLTGCASDGMRSGAIRRTPSGLGSLWLECPIEAAVEAAKEGGIKVGWVYATVELLRARPLRCFRCLEVGHVAITCTSGVDRARRCYRCGSVSHKAASCREGIPRCPLCLDLGRPFQHVLGGTGCRNDIPPLTRSSNDGGGGVAAQDDRAASSSAG